MSKTTKNEVFRLELDELPELAEYNKLDDITSRLFNEFDEHMEQMQSDPYLPHKFGDTTNTDYVVITDFTSENGYNCGGNVGYVSAENGYDLLGEIEHFASDYTLKLSDISIERPKPDVPYFKLTAHDDSEPTPNTVTAIIAPTSTAVTTLMAEIHSDHSERVFPSLDMLQRWLNSTEHDDLKVFGEKVEAVRNFNMWRTIPPEDLTSTEAAFADNMLVAVTGNPSEQGIGVKNVLDARKSPLALVQKALTDTIEAVKPDREADIFPLLSQMRADEYANLVPFPNGAELFSLAKRELVADRQASPLERSFMINLREVVSGAHMQGFTDDEIMEACKKATERLDETLAYHRDNDFAL